MHNGKQPQHCHDCGRQGVDGFAHCLIAEDKRTLIERLLLERLTLRGMCRAVGVTCYKLLEIERSIIDIRRLLMSPFQTVSKFFPHI